MNCIKKFKNSEKYTKYSVYAIVIFSIIALSLASIYHVSGDGCWHIPAGKFIANIHKFPLFEPLGRDEPFWSPPLYHMTVAFVYYIFNAFNHNAANFAVKFVSPIFGILSLVFSFLVIKRLISSKIAFYSTVFLAFVPIFMDYSIFSYAESMLVFFVILSVYFLIDGRYVLAGIAAGLSILTKYNGVFILPVLICILQKYSKNKKTFYKNVFIIVILALLIASPWFIRNWVLLGNPIWPFLNSIFNGHQSQSYNKLDLRNLINPNAIAFTYLGIYGVPDGNYAAFKFLNVPHAKLLLAVWLAGTIIFVIPLIAGFFNAQGKSNHIFILWILSYLLLFLVYVVNVGFSVSRMMLPAFPALAVFWAYGYNKLAGINFKKIVAVLIILIIAGFAAAELSKILIAADAWGFYKEDFEWVKANTNINAVFIANGQCVPYNIERTSLYANDENLKKADYMWVNRDFRLDKRSALDAGSIKLLQSGKYKIAYSNDATGTKIYVLKQ